MRTELLLGVDIGTTSVKVALTDVAGEVWGTETRTTPWRHTLDGGTETDPDQLTTALLTMMVSLTDHASATHGDVVVAAIGITGMAETGVLLDGKDTPVAPSVAWHDPRSMPQSQRLEPELGTGVFQRETGLPVSPRSSAVTFRWLRETRPETAGGRRWLDIPAYLAYRLCAIAVADRSLAARSGFLDLVRGTWSDTLLDWAGVSLDLLPPLVEPGAAAGNVRDIHPRLDGAVVTVAGHDHLVASVGAGALAITDVFDSCGTGEALIRQLQCPRTQVEGVRSALDRDTVAAAVADGLTVGWHVLPNRQVLMAGLGSGRILRRFLALLGAGADEQRRAQLDEQALAAPPGADGMRICHPAEPEAGLAGIPWEPTPGLIWRAALEAVADRGTSASTLLERYAGPSARLVAAGGWLRSPGVRGIKAEYLGSYEIPQVDEAGARGAALLSALAAGYYSGCDELPAPATTTIAPPSRQQHADIDTLEKGRSQCAR